MRICTVGYEGRSLAGFLAALRAAGVARLVDVREAPVSRKPGFSKHALARALRDVGIEYVHAKALGCPKPIRDAHRADHDWPRYVAGFGAHLAAQDDAVAATAAACRAAPTALLCYEADPGRCHRTFVARAVAAAAGGDAAVVHLVGEGAIPDAAGIGG